jgi:hypothetical protein
VYIWLYGVYLLVVSINIPAIQQPLPIQLNGNTTMAACVPDKWDHDDFYLCYPDRRQAIKTEPLIVVETMDLPPGMMQPVFRPVRSPFHQSLGMKESRQLILIDMDGRLRKIGQSTRMVQVQVRQKNMSHI